MSPVRRGNQWPLLPYFDRARRRFGAAGPVPKQTSLTLFPTAARHGNCESPSDASAPPPVPDRRTKPATELVGIARLAASSPRAEAKRGTEYFLLPVKSILNECHSERVPFRWTVNPYRGCEFGCQYCYARYTHEYMELDGSEFEIENLREAGCRAAGGARPGDQENLGRAYRASEPRPIPTSRPRTEFGATRAILEKMAEREGLSVSDHHEIESGGARYRFAAADFGAIVADGQYEHHDAANAIGATARAASAAAGFAPGRRCGNCARREFPPECSPCRYCPG